MPARRLCRATSIVVIRLIQVPHHPMPRQCRHACQAATSVGQRQHSTWHSAYMLLPVPAAARWYFQAAEAVIMCMHAVLLGSAPPSACAPCGKPCCVRNDASPAAVLLLPVQIERRLPQRQCILRAAAAKVYASVTFSCIMIKLLFLCWCRAIPYHIQGHARACCRGRCRCAFIVRQVRHSVWRPGRVRARPQAAAVEACEFRF